MLGHRAALYAVRAYRIRSDLWSDQSVRIDATFENIGINYTISGDDDLNSSLQIKYKVQGSSTYKNGAMSMRAHPGLIVDGSALNMNFHAASAMYLKPNTTYNIQLVLTDPDGGSVTTTVTTKTKAIPQPSLNSIKYVSPGSGGGAGNQRISGAPPITTSTSTI